jgi:flagellar biosynthesis/type III secretory pathway chaperone
MTDKIRDTIASLVRLMQEESAVLQSAGPRHDIDAIAGAKLRLTAALEADLALLGREQPDWHDALPAEGRAALAADMAELRTVSEANATILRRQIELSRELMDAIAAEAKRLAGSRTQTYGASGGIFCVDGSMPISINTSL